MVLKFKFTYKSSDKTLVKFLDFASKQFDCSYKIYQELDFVFLFIQADEKTLEEFSSKLSLYVPMSIFYYGVEVDVIENLPKELEGVLTQAFEYITEPRYSAVTSKIGEVTIKDIGKVMGFMTKDILEDFRR